MLTFGPTRRGFSAAKALTAVTVVLFGGLAGNLSGKQAAADTFTNSIGIAFKRIEPGGFEMGFGRKQLSGNLVVRKGHFKNGDFDERPAHRVTISKPFYMGVCEVTNAQYEMFDPEHKRFRGRAGFCVEDDEAVVFVSWHDAVHFCDWLSRKEHKPYRLPTEAEWEYACRAGTTTSFHAGDVLPEGFVKGNIKTAAEEPVPLHVGQTAPNPWGLYDMHGNVEEWCYDWYGPYQGGHQVDPTGCVDGDFKVTRGGSHSTWAYYLRSANRMGTLPEDKHWLIGFRVLIGEMPKTQGLPRPKPQPFQENVSRQIPPDLTKGPNPDKPYFKGPTPFVKIPAGSTGPLYWKHSHFLAVTECPNGDLLAAWFNCMEEMGRELCVAASRLRYGEKEWEPASVFWDAPDRNDHAHALWYDGERTIYHFNGLGTRWRNLAVLLRRSTDNGANWSKARLILPDHDTGRHTVVESVFRAQDGRIVLPFDGRRGSIILLSSDNGHTWTDPGGNIRGTHAGVTQLADGRLMALGRHGAINGQLPRSISSDMGKSWIYTAGPFTSIHTGRRLALMRLKDGTIFCASFARNMKIKNNTQEQHTINGLFGAVSFDEGETWPHIRVLCAGQGRNETQTMDGDPYTIDSATGEPIGYLSVCQSQDGIIHLLSSREHYAFNVTWLTTLPPAPPPPEPEPAASALKAKANLPSVYKPKGLPSQDDWQWELLGRGLKEAELVSLLGPPKDGLKIHTERSGFYFRSEKLDGFSAVEPAKGFTGEIKAQILENKANDHGVAFELYDGNGSRYAISITRTGVYWYQGTVQSSGLLPFSQYVPLIEGVNNTDCMYTYRLAVRPDRIVQIYRDGQLIGTKRRMYRTPRFGYVFFGAGGGSEALVEYIAYDLTGPYGP